MLTCMRDTTHTHTHTHTDRRTHTRTHARACHNPHAHVFAADNDDHATDAHVQYHDFSLCMCVRVFCLSVCQSVCQSVSLSVCQSFCIIHICTQYIYVFTHVCINACVYQVGAESVKTEQGGGEGASIPLVEILPVQLLLMYLSSSQYQRGKAHFSITIRICSTTDLGDLCRFRMAMCA